MIRNGKNLRLKRFRKGSYGLWAKLVYGYPIYFDRTKKLLIDTLFEFVYHKFWGMFSYSDSFDDHAFIF